VVGETAPFTPTIQLSDEALGQFVNILEQRRNGNDVTPTSDVAACFPMGDWDLAMEYSLLEYNSILAVASSSYEYENAMALAEQVIVEHGLSTFPNFGEEFYKKILTFTRAEDIIAMCDLPPDDLDAKIEAFMDKNTDLKQGSNERKMASRMRRISLLRSGSIMRGSAKLLCDGLAGLVRLADGSYAILTMGTLAMVEKERMSRIICPGAALRYKGDRYDNEVSIPFNKYLLVSPTRSLAFDTNAHGQSTKLDDATYGSRTIKIGGESRLFRRLHENRVCSKPCEKYKDHSELIRISVT
jgi:hypothetical protein